MKQAASIEDRYTIPGGFVLAICEMLKSSGCDSNALASEAGIELSDTIGPLSRVPVRAVAKLWRLAESDTADSCIGLAIHPFIKPTTFPALGSALWTSSTIREALVRLVRHWKMLNTASDKTFEKTDEGYCFTISARTECNDISWFSDHAIDSFLASIIAICRSIDNNNFSPLCVHLTRSRPPGIDKHQTFFNAPVKFSSPQNKLIFDKESIETPLATGDPEMAQQIDLLIANRIALMEKKDILNRVYAAVVKLLPSGTPKEEVVAQSLNLHVRTLQRKLHDADTNYRRLLDGTRRELACSYILQPHLTLDEISYLLGFSEKTNFIRAFKRWEGLSPGNYREEYRRDTKYTQ